MLTAVLFNSAAAAKAGIRRLATSLGTIFRNRVALNQLSQLDDRTLADIGLTRLDVANAKAQPVHKDPYILDPFAARRRQTARSAKVSASEIEVPAHGLQPVMRYGTSSQACC